MDSCILEQGSGSLPTPAVLATVALRGLSLQGFWGGEQGNRVSWIFRVLGIEAIY